MKNSNQIISQKIHANLLKQFQIVDEIRKKICVIISLLVISLILQSVVMGLPLSVIGYYYYNKHEKAFKKETKISKHYQESLKKECCKDVCT